MASEIVDLNMQGTNDFLEAKLMDTWQQVKAFN
jgi:hypothetical protein